MFTWFTWYHWRPALLCSLWSPSGLDDAGYLNICCVGAFTRCFGSQRHNCEPGAGSLHWCHLRKPGAGAVLDQDWLWCCGCLSTGAGCLRLTVIFAAAASPGPGQAGPGRAGSPRVSLDDCLTLFGPGHSQEQFRAKYFIRYLQIYCYIALWY